MPIRIENKSWLNPLTVSEIVRVAQEFIGLTNEELSGFPIRFVNQRNTDGMNNAHLTSGVVRYSKMLADNSKVIHDVTVRIPSSSYMKHKHSFYSEFPDYGDKFGEHNAMLAGRVQDSIFLARYLISVTIHEFRHVYDAYRPYLPDSYRQQLAQGNRRRTTWRKRPEEIRAIAEQVRAEDSKLYDKHADLVIDIASQLEDVMKC